MLANKLPYWGNKNAGYCIPYMNQEHPLLKHAGA